MFSARLLQNIYQLVQIYYGDAMAATVACPSAAGAFCPFPPHYWKERDWIRKV